MKLNRSWILLGFTLMGCKTQSNQRNQPPPTLSPNPTTSQAEPCPRGKIQDPPTGLCVAPNERACFELNKIAYARECVDPRPVGSRGFSYTALDLTSFCKQNDAGALFDCQDGQAPLKIPALPTFEGAPEIINSGRRAVQIEWEQSWQAIGRVTVKFKNPGDVEALSVGDNQGRPIVLRRLTTQDEVMFSVSFQPGTILHRGAAVKSSPPLVMLDEPEELTTLLTQKQLPLKWFADETLRIMGQTRKGQELYDSWQKLVEVSGAIEVYRISRDCPQAERVSAQGIETCRVGVSLQAQASWKGRYFVNLCRTSTRLPIVRKAGPDQVGMLETGVFPNTDFTIELPAGIRTLGDCSIYAFEI